MTADQDNTIIDRQSIQYHLPYEGDLETPSPKDGFGRTVDSFYPFMLEQDVRNTVFPYRLHGEPERTIKLEPYDAHTAKVLQQALSWGHGSSGRFEDTVAEWLRDCVHRTVAAGTAAYEIAVVLDAQSGSSVGMLLIPLRWDHLRVRRATVIQRVPDEISIPHEAESPTASQRQAVIRRDRILLVKDPVLKSHQLEALGVIGGSRYPRFFLDSMGNRSEGTSSRNVPFDFNDFHEAQDRAIAAATAGIGWNARGSFVERQTDPYFVVRQLRFERYKISLRRTVVDALNVLIERNRERFSLQGNVVLEGFVSPRDIEEAEASLQAGTCSLQSLIERFR